MPLLVGNMGALQAPATASCGLPVVMVMLLGLVKLFCNLFCEASYLSHREPRVRLKSAEGWREPGALWALWALWAPGSRSPLQTQDAGHSYAPKEVEELRGSACALRGLYTAMSPRPLASRWGELGECERDIRHFLKYPGVQVEQMILQAKKDSEARVRHDVLGPFVQAFVGRVARPLDPHPPHLGRHELNVARSQLTQMEASFGNPNRCRTTIHLHSGTLSELQNTTNKAPRDQQSRPCTLSCKAYVTKRYGQCCLHTSKTSPVQVKGCIE